MFEFLNITPMTLHDQMYCFLSVLTTYTAGRVIFRIFFKISFVKYEPDNTKITLQIWQFSFIRSITRVVVLSFASLSEAISVLYFSSVHASVPCPS